NNLRKLFPNIHFVHSKYAGKRVKIRNKIQLLRSRIFTDKIANPMLLSYDEKLEPKVATLMQNENFVLQDYLGEKDKLKKYLIESGISQYYDNLDDFVLFLIKKIEAIDNTENSNWGSLSVL